MIKAKVSIITVVYNAVDTIERTIKSVLDQDYENVEYIIIDGASTDGTTDILKKYKSKISRIISEPDDGIYYAMNRGIQEATGEVIGILNSDDWYEKNVLSQIIKVFETRETDIVYGKIKRVYNNGKIEEVDRVVPLDTIWYNMAVYHPATFVRKSVYNKVGYFDTSYRIASDYDFILRCYIDNIKFTYYNQYLTNFSLGGVSSNMLACTKEHIKIAQKYISKCPNPEIVEKELRWKWNRAILDNVLKRNPKIIVSVLEEYFHLGKVDKIIIYQTYILVNSIIYK